MSKDGKDLELLVQMIERSISPESKIEHNVLLPILNSPSGATTQCDIVIRTGKPPRETITIVEVQDRGSQVKPNDFRGWKQKLVDVGAQHLICVSRQEFPASIKEQAILSGNSIHLVTLQELTADKIPIDLFKFVFTYRNFDIIETMNCIPKVSRSELEKLGIREKVLAKTDIPINEKCWSLDKHELISMHALCLRFFMPPKGIIQGEGKLIFDQDSEISLYLYESGHFVKIGLEFEFKWKNEISRIPLSLLAYEQNQYGVLAWAIDFAYNSPQGLISLKIPIVKKENGFVIREMSVSMPLETELVLSEGDLEW